MRILHLRVANFYGGPERQIHLHALAARRRGLAVEVATFVEGGGGAPWLDVVEADGVPVHRIPVASAYDPGAVARLRTLLDRGAFDLLATHEYRSTLLAPAALRGTPAAWIAFSRGSTRDDLKVRTFQVLESLALRLARRVVAVSGAQKQKLVRQGLAPSKVDVVANAIDPERFEGVAPLDLRARFGFADGDRVVVAGGRFSAEKGQDLLVDAAWAAHKRVPSLRVVLFGDGPDREALRQKVRRLGLEGIVRCPGFEPGMVAALKGADLLVNPSHSEGLPNIVLEAMAVATPVVATAVGGVPEIVEDGRTGRLVPPGDKAALAEAIVRALEEDETSRRMARLARERLRERQGFDAQLDALLAVYRRVCPDACRRASAAAATSASARA